MRGKLLGGGRRSGVAVLVALVMVAVALSGCVGELEEFYSFEPDERYVNPGVFPGNYQLAGSSGSTPLQAGTLPYSKSPEIFRLRSAIDGELIPMAVWRPFDGLVDGGVPVIVDAGPYFEMMAIDPDTGEPVPSTIDMPQQRGEAYMAHFVPHGYAYAQIAVRGTGTHGGCMELMSNNEARDLSQAVTFLAEMPWSNGNVSMIGASYDGSTPWMVAAQGNPHLKAIVPVSGLPDIFDLMFHNGTAETRGPIMHSAVYWPFGFNRIEELDTAFATLNSLGVPVPAGPPANGVANGERTPAQEVDNAVCPEMVKGSVMGPLATITGMRDPDAVGYWAERNYRDDVLANYNGSVFLIHGLQDWNVDPHAAIPFNQELEDAGIEVKQWYGQWGHAYPDSFCAKEYPDWIWTPCRLDWHEVLLRYFDATLKGEDRDHGASTHVQDSYGQWRTADSWPPRDADWVDLHATSDGLLSDSPGGEGSAMLLPPGDGPTNYLEFKTEIFEQDTVVAGLPQFKVSYEAQGPGGFLGAFMWDEDANGTVLGRCVWNMDTYQTSCQPVLVAHGQMDLRFRDGGNDVAPSVPGQVYTAHFEFEPAEVFIPAGHRLTVWLFQYQYADHMSGPVPSPVKVMFGGDNPSVLRLPIVDVDPLDRFPVPGSHPVREENFDRYMVAKPPFPNVVPPMNAARAQQAECMDAMRDHYLGTVPVGTVPVDLVPVVGSDSAAAVVAACGFAPVRVG